MDHPATRRLVLALLLLLLLSAGTGETQNPSRLEEFYIVDVWETDIFPYLTATILDVRSQESGSKVKYISIEAATPLCARPEISAIEKSSEGVNIEQLQGHADLCAMHPDKVADAVAEFSRKPGSWETSRRAIVANCAGEVKVFHLPEYRMALTRLAQAAPDVYSLTRAGDELLATTFPDARDPDWVREHLSKESGAALADEVRTGRYDLGFWECTDGMHPGLPARVVDRIDPTFGSGCDRDKLHNILARYIAPGKITYEGKVIPVSVRDTPRFSKYVSPGYPAEALKKQVYGTVEVRFSANPVTGSVEDVDVGILKAELYVVKDSVLEAARQWRVDTSEDLRKSFTIYLRFLLECKPSQ